MIYGIILILALLTTHSSKGVSLKTQEVVLAPLPHLAKTIISPSLTIYHVVPTCAGQPFKLEIFDLSGPLTPHYHKMQTHTITVIEGILDVQIDDQEPLRLRPLESVTIFPYMMHSLKSSGKWVRFSKLASPAIDVPEDVYETSPFIP